jgi:hypothetical protein
MSTQPTEPPVLFANTGVQILCFPLRPGLRFPADQIGSGWQHCQCKVDDEVAEHGFIQWQILRDKLFLAVDTTIGPEEAEVGYFAKASSLGGDHVETLTELLGLNNEPLDGIPPIEFVIRPATAKGGDPKDVHMMIDFGNTRTGAILLEFRGDTKQEPLMTPLQLLNRYHLDAWDESGNLSLGDPSWWFSSKSHWCTTPYLPPPRLQKTVYKQRTVRRPIFGQRVIQVPVTVFETPRTFEDFSMVRMGREADDLAGVMRIEGQVRTGVSSPKRYLWAKDASWLEGANWYMADPFDRYDPQYHATTVKGPFLRFFPEDDAPDDPSPTFEEAPNKPRYAPRTLMIGALYELLCQAYAHINSSSYRRMTAEVGRMRQLRTLTLTYPSGMIAAERLQLQKQAYKAISIFMQTLGRSQGVQPELKLSVDEASAVHLTYIWSEVQKLGRRPTLWFSVMGRQPAPQPEAEAEPSPPPEQPSRRLSPGRGHSRRGRHRAERGSKQDASSAEGPEVRIACIDIGGGTSDLMIAKYTCDADLGGDVIRGETLHRDGISMAGDHLVKRLLETIIVPQFADVVGLELNDVETLFGKEVPANRHFRAERIHWINRLFVPLAQAYLENAVDEVEENISHTDPNLVAPEVVQSLQERINREWKAGKYNVKQDLNLYYDREEFEDVVDSVFADLLLDFCESIVEHKADVVLLAGQPTKLRYIRRLVETFLPLPKSRIIPMFGRYAGTWYPYQNPDGLNPGVIVDPKSTVVVGAAIEFCARFGMLAQFSFDMTDKAAKKSYYWGVMTDSGIHSERIIFERHPEGESSSSVERKEVSVAAQNLIIGRKRRRRENAQASPVYWLKVLRGSSLGQIELKVALERRLGSDGQEELAVESVEGEVDGEPAVLHENVLFEWRTLADERYYLDTGGLDKLELG